MENLQWKLSTGEIFLAFLLKFVFENDLIINLKKKLRFSDPLWMPSTLYKDDIMHSAH